jgi:hypothetical protein
MKRGEVVQMKSWSNEWGTPEGLDCETSSSYKSTSFRRCFMLLWTDRLFLYRSCHNHSQWTAPVLGCIIVTGRSYARYICITWFYVKANSIGTVFTSSTDPRMWPIFLLTYFNSYIIHKSHVLLLSIRDHFRACADHKYWNVPRFSIQRKVGRKRNRLEIGLKNVRKQNLKQWKMRNEKSQWKLLHHE